MIKFVNRSLYGILIFFMGLFIASSFFLRAKYNYFQYGDKPVLESQQWGPYILVIALLLVFSIALYRLCLKLNKYPRRYVIPVTLLASFGIQVGIIFAFTRLPTDDSQTVLSLALNMLYQQDYSTFQTGGYLYMFPYNFSIVLYLKTLLALFPDNYLVIKLFNILFTLVTTLMTYLIYKEINTKSREKDYGVLVLAATYIPSLFMCNLIYNDVIGTAFLTSALYFVVRFVKERSLKHIVYASILLAVGNYFRSVGAITLAAAGIYILLRAKHIGWKKVLPSLVILGILFHVPGWTQNALLQSNGIVKESVTQNSAPVYMWLHMGINLDTYGFWDNMQSYNIYQRQAGYNKEKSTELFKQAIEAKWSKASAGDLVKMYYKKIVWTWTEGTYQMDRYGLGNDGSGGKGMRAGPIMGSYSYKTFATELFKGNSSYRSGLLWLVYGMNVLMYVCMLIRLIGGFRAKRHEEVPLILVILGFIGFYILWEIKSRYIYPVYPILLMFSYMGFQDAYEFMMKQGLSRLLPFRREGLRKDA